MNNVSVIQPHSMMQKSSHHNASANSKNPSSAFSDYLFGPAGASGGQNATKASTSLANAKQAVENRSKTGLLHV